VRLLGSEALSNARKSMSALSGAGLGALIDDLGDASAKRALEVTKRTSFMLSGAQLGITVTGLLSTTGSAHC